MAQALPAVALAKAGLRPQDARREAQGAELGAKREDLVTFFFLLPTPDSGLPSNNYHDSLSSFHTSDLIKSVP
jgi:hypothetical protein